MKTDKFAKICTAAFGDKVHYGLVKPEMFFISVDGGPVKTESPALEILQFELGTQVWAAVRMPTKGLLFDHPVPCCPNCDAALFGSFQWEIIHGQGFCSNCREVSFLAYHYLSGGDRIVAFEVSGISKKIAKLAKKKMKGD